MRPLLLFAVCLLSAAPAEAQWLLTTLTGGNYTRPSTITIDRPDQGMALEFVDVHYDAKPLKSPQYYGARLGRFFGDGPLGFDVEFLHIKVYARVDDLVHVRGTLDGFPIDTTLRMNQLVHRYNHTHGLNFLFGNLLWRVASSPRAALVVRAGAGPVRPGRDVVMPGLNVQGYQLAGWGQQLGVGGNIVLKGRLGAMAEYKLTHARPELDLTNGGKGRLSAVTHHIATGITIAIGKE